MGQQKGEMGEGVGSAYSLVKSCKWSVRYVTCISFKDNSEAL